LYPEVAQARPALGAAALYDAANTLLLEADRIAARGDWVGARPLFELAKETYREALRLEPHRWEVRYNLERALRLAPEQEDEGTAGPLGGHHCVAEHAAMRGADVPLHALVETHGALAEVQALAAHPRIQSLSFGLMDFVSAHRGADGSAPEPSGVLGP